MSLTRRVIRALLQFIGLLTVIGVLVAGIAALILPRYLQVTDTPQKSDYIVPLGGGWHRYIKAAELYKEGFAPRILLSNDKLPEETRFRELRREIGMPEADVRELRLEALTHLGVPESALESFGNEHISTVEEAEALRALVGQPARIILVTSPFHTRRAKIIFEDVMPETEFLMAAPPERSIENRWWSDQQSAGRAASETIKLVYYLIGGRFRSDDGCQTEN